MNLLDTLKQARESLINAGSSSYSANQLNEDAANLAAAIAELEKTNVCKHQFVTTFGGDHCTKCNAPAPSNEYPAPQDEQMKNDAARYRFIRQLDAAGIHVYNCPSDCSIFGCELDNAIDAAMEKQP